MQPRLQRHIHWTRVAASCNRPLFSQTLQFSTPIHVFPTGAAAAASFYNPACAHDRLCADCLGMGIQLSTIQTPQFNVLFAEDLPDYRLNESLGEAHFLRSYTAYNKQKQLVVVKSFVNKLQDFSITPICRRLKSEQDQLNGLPNVLPYTEVAETSRAAYIMRPYIATSLYDRISTRPFLELTEKKWIMYQLLRGLNDCHERNIFHGDIKTENVLVTSWDWAYLSDFSSFKPTYLPEDNPADYNYFFDASSRRVCYIAPERFVPANELRETRLNAAMDIFSLGCVFGEILLEGTPVFTLSQLFDYKTEASYHPQKLLSRIENKDMQDLILHMLQLDPAKRLSAKDYLVKFEQTVFPELFSSILYPYFTRVLEPESVVCQINQTVNYIDIWTKRLNTLLHDIQAGSLDDYASDDLPAGMEDAFAATLYRDGSTRSGQTDAQLLNSCQRFITNLSNTLNKEGKENAKVYNMEDAFHFATVLLPFLLSFIRISNNRRTRKKVLLLAVDLAKYVPDELKLDAVLPFIVSALADSRCDIRITALYAITDILSSVNVIAPINAFIFHEYVFPELQRLLTDRELRVRAAYASCISTLAKHASRYLNMAQSLRNAGVLSFPETAYDSVDHGKAEQLFESGRHELLVTVEWHVSTLLADASSEVRRALLSSLAPLCSFFGKAKADDVMLSHLITYMNDSDWMLRCAFFDSVVGVAAFVGARSIDEYVLPLMQQALFDVEPNVVESVVHAFAVMLELNLFPKLVVQKILHSVMPLVILPNPYLRRAVLGVMFAAYNSQDEIDQQCFVYPIISPYLLCDTPDIRDHAQLDSLVIPSMSLEAWRILLGWHAKAGKDSQFWSKSALDTKLSSKPQTLLEPGVYHSPSNLPPLSLSDNHWVSTLRKFGLAEKHLWIVANLRPLIKHVSSSTAWTDLNMKRIRTNVQELSSFRGSSDTSPAIVPEIVFWNTESSSVLDDELSNTSILRGSSRASSRTQKRNSMRTALSGPVVDPFLRVDSGSVVSISDAVKHSSYKGNDPLVLKCLEKQYRETLAAQVDLGPTVPSRLTMKGSLEQQQNKAYHKDQKPSRWPEGRRIWCYTNTRNKNARIRQVLASPDSTFFCTLGNDGLVQLWAPVANNKKLVSFECKLSYPHHEGRHPGSSLPFSPIVTGCFVGPKHALATIAEDLSFEIHRFNVQTSRHVFIREGNLKATLHTNERVLLMQAASNDDDIDATIAVATSHSRVLVFNASQLALQFDLQSSLEHGLLSSMALAANGSYLILGTSLGYIDLWDLRFRIKVRSWFVTARVDAIQMVGSLATLAEGDANNDVSNTQLLLAVSRPRPKNLRPFNSPVTGSAAVIEFDIRTGKTKAIYLDSWDTTFPLPIPIPSVDSFSLTPHSMDYLSESLSLYSWPSTVLPLYAVRFSADQPVPTAVDLLLVSIGGSGRSVCIWNTADIVNSVCLTRTTDSSKWVTIKDTDAMETQGIRIHSRVPMHSTNRPRSSGASRSLTFLREQKQLQQQEFGVFAITGIAIINEPCTLLLVADAGGNLELWT
ncbi:VPS15 protein kinase Ppk19 [Schizosaccharomyces japonicus yFS275]|uniref:non-specific serine/threonine protein kinase n=1 Tax=Schizosaccharomyces japonicus (strain yFS275 / FY16936) TaxID=402676 RepID=B6K748_SCHJY|nr:VPS15 protein kinase Ppk19 [Schizosaccharomyces japonicus yFS275]EEB09352.1 VPS15 protein kinase Ppk19 [Schizosaccharomyces japonicus yFS275]